jgi:outer membrane protein assembly factor BamB
MIDDDGIIYAASVGSSRLSAVYPNNGTVKWRFHANDWIYSSPAIDDNGVIYIGSHDDCLYAIYPNGTMKWKYRTYGELKSSPAIGDDGTIYVCSWDYYLYAINPNGSLRWKYDTGSWTETSPTIAQDGTIYVGNYIGRIFSINPNGGKNWHFDTGDSILSSPAVDKNGVIYVGSMDGYLYALNPDGTLKWKFLASDDGIQSSVAIAEDGTIYIAAYFKPSGGQGSYTYLYALEVIENEPPDKPTITGRLKGNPGKSYAYTFNAVDPDGDNVSYYIDWGDGTSDGWTDYYESGQDLNIAHTWNKINYFSIRCKAKDICGAEGNWTDLIIHIPRNRAVHNTLFLKFLEQFPLLERLLSFLF